MPLTKISQNQIKATQPQQVVTELSSADILALHTTPIEIAPAPGANKAIVPYLITFVAFTTGQTPYADGNSLDVLWGSNAPYSGVIDNLVLSEADSSIAMYDLSTFINIAAISELENEPLVLSTSMAFTAGTATAKVTTYYNIIDLS